MADEPYRAAVGSLLLALEQQQHFYLTKGPDYAGRVQCDGTLDLNQLAKDLEMPRA